MIITIYNHHWQVYKVYHIFHIDYSLLSTEYNQQYAQNSLRYIWYTPINIIQVSFYKLTK
jgi:hypothetical protein